MVTLALEGGDSFCGAGAAGSFGTLIGLFEQGAGPRPRGGAKRWAGAGSRVEAEQRSGQMGGAGPEVGSGGGAGARRGRGPEGGAPAKDGAGAAVQQLYLSLAAPGAQRSHEDNGLSHTRVCVKKWELPDPAGSLVSPVCPGPLRTEMDEVAGYL